MQQAQVTGNGKNRQPVVMPERCGLAEQKRNDWVVDVELGVTDKDILDPAFWVHMAPNFTPFDTIEVRSEDGSWIAYLRVLFAERNFAKVMIERPTFQVGVNMEPASKSLLHRVDWKGPHHKFAVIRLSDSEMLKAEFKTREEATAWMAEHEKTVRA